MKKKLVMLLTAILLVSVFVTAFPVASARWRRRRRWKWRCELFLTLNPAWLTDPTQHSWEGTVSGHIEGDIKIWLLGMQEYAPYAVFWEDWIIETDDGTITLLNVGAVSFDTLKVESTGPVVAATDEWEYLIGSAMFTLGEVFDYPPAPDQPLPTCVCKMMIVRG